GRGGPVAADRHRGAAQRPPGLPVRQHDEHVRQFLRREPGPACAGPGTGRGGAADGRGRRPPRPAGGGGGDGHPPGGGGRGGAGGGAGLSYRVTPAGLTEDITLASPSAASSFSFTVTVSGGLVPYRRAGQVVFSRTGPGGPAVAVMPRPFMTDARRDRWSPS